MRWQLCVASVIGAVVSCASFGSNGSPDADAGGADAGDAADLDDAAAVPDSAATDAATRFCDGVDAELCDDFDEGDLGARWDNEQQRTGSQLALSPSDGGRDLLVSFDASDGGQFNGTALEKVFPGATAFRFGVDVDVTPLGGKSAYFELAKLALGNGLGDVTISFDGTLKVVMAQVAQGAGAVDLGTLRLQGRVEVTATFTPTWKLDVSWNGQPFKSVPSTYVNPPPTTPLMQLGFVFSQPHDAGSFRVDNFVFDVL